jgi:hypothetical protein
LELLTPCVNVVAAFASGRSFAPSFRIFPLSVENISNGIRIAADRLVLYPDAARGRSQVFAAPVGAGADALVALAV